ncbi:ankyrin repeat protein [Metarhizium robertsii]|uniref:Ankyrin repeat protein n=1 Tax=Metarhizium robertsii TaxID=568076 RepID=A0A0A1UYW5_9HYPO|nr:ankyrin repeat protein [Metarhizium robertsii]
MDNINNALNLREKIEPWQVFDLIGGSGVGGLLAIMLGRLRMSVQQCISGYSNLSQILSAAPKRGIFLNTWKVITRKEQKFKVVDIEKWLKNLSVQSLDLLLNDKQPGRVYVIQKNNVLLRSYTSLDTEPLTSNIRVWEAARASIALPPLTFGDMKYKYPSSNNPVFTLFEEAWKLWPDRAVDAIIVSIGTGTAPPPSLDLGSRKPVRQLQTLAAASESISEEFRRTHIPMASSGRYFRFNADLPLDTVSLDDAPLLSHARSATAAYLEAGKTSVEFHRCCENISEPNLTRTAIAMKQGEKNTRLFQPPLHLFVGSLFERPYGAKPHTIIPPNSVPKWIFQSHEYLSWLSRQESLFWLYGPPGVGKTQFCLHISQNTELLCSPLKDSTENQLQHVMLCFFCSIFHSPEDGVRLIVAGLLYQLVLQYPDALEYLGTLTTRQLTTQNLLDMFQSAITNTLKANSIQGVTLVIDGVDESDPLITLPVLRYITSLGDKMRLSTSFLRFLLTSREGCFNQLFPSSEGQALDTFTLRFDRYHGEIDVAKFVYSELEKEEYEALDSAFKVDLKAHIVERSMGNFLFARFLLGQLKYKQRAQALEIVGRSPRNIMDTYESAVEKVDLQDVDHLANLLKWVVMARRPLSLPELSAATRTGNNRRDRADEDRIQRILQNCAALCFIRDGTVILSHATVIDYLLGHAREPFRIEPEHAELSIAERCLDCLTDEEWASDSSFLEDSGLGLIEFDFYPLLEYAFLFWPDHERSVQHLAPAKRKKSTFYNAYSLQRSSWYVFYDRNRVSRKVGKSHFPTASADSFTAMHMAAYLDLTGLAAELLETRKTAVVDSRDSRGRSPAAYAAYFGHVMTLRLLLEKVPLFDTLDNQGNSLLHFATLGGSAAAVDILLMAGVNVMARDGSGDTALHVAAREGRLEIAQLLVQFGADVDGTNKYHSTPLHEASRAGNLSIAHYLLNHGANIMIADNEGCSALHEAAANGHKELVVLLLENRTDASIRDTVGQTALVAATAAGHADVVEALIRRTTKAEGQSWPGQEDMGIANDPCGHISDFLKVFEGHKADDCVIEIETQWEVLQFMDEEMPEGQDLSRLLTLSGTSSQAVAKQAGEYIMLTWPVTGPRTLHVLNSALFLSRTCQESPSRLAWSGAFLIDVTIYPRNMQDSSSEKAVVKASRTKTQVMEIAQQVAWFSAAFRPPLENCLGYSILRMHTNGIENGVIYLSIKPQKLVDKEPSATADPIGKCWHPLFQNSVLAYGFPVPKRGNQKGLELSYHEMRSLSGAKGTSEFKSRTILLGPRFVIYPTKLGSDFIEWHLVPQEEKQSLAWLVQFHKIPKVELPWRLSSMKAFLGFCTNAVVLVGTAFISCDKIKNSGAREEGRTLRVKDEGIQASLSVSVGAGSLIPMPVTATAGISGGVQISKGLRQTQSQNSRGRDAKLNAAKTTVVLIYDTQRRVGWLVPELSAALWLAHSLIRNRLELGLQDPEDEQKIQEVLESMDANLDSDGHNATLAVLRQHKAVGLWVDDRDHTKRVSFLDVIEYILDCFRARREKLEDRCQQLLIFPKKNRLYGWEASEIAEEKATCYRKEQYINRKFRGPRPWQKLRQPLCELGANPEYLVLFSKELKDLVLPANGTTACRLWKQPPMNQNFLIASTQCIIGLAESKGCYNSGQKFMLTERMGWSGPSKQFYGCDKKGCNFVQKMVGNPKKFNNFDTLRSACMGALVFGDPSAFGKAKSCKTETVSWGPRLQAHVSPIPSHICPPLPAERPLNVQNWIQIVPPAGAFNPSSFQMIADASAEEIPTKVPNPDQSPCDMGKAPVEVLMQSFPSSPTSHSARLSNTLSTLSSNNSDQHRLSLP